MTDLLRRLQSACKRMPGIGERQAMRIAYFLATADTGYVDELVETISRARKGIKRCTRCYALSEKIDSGLCTVCSNPAADAATLLVVEKDVDRERFIRSGAYTGTYFILGGLVPAIEKDVDQHIRLRELAALIKKEVSSGLSEVILALSATPDGSRTEHIVIETLRKEFGDTLSCSVLGRGLSTGTEIEYSDSDTLSHALRSRSQL